MSRSSAHWTSSAAPWSQRTLLSVEHVQSRCMEWQSLSGSQTWSVTVDLCNFCGPFTHRRDGLCFLVIFITKFTSLIRPKSVSKLGCLKVEGTTVILFLKCFFLWLNCNLAGHTCPLLCYFDVQVRSLLHFCFVLQNPDDLFECISQALLNAVDRDAVSGWGGIVYIM